MKTSYLFLAIVLSSFMSMNANQVTGFVYNADSTEIVYSDVKFTNVSTGQSYESFTSWSGYQVDIPAGTYSVQVTDIFNLFEVGNFGPYDIPNSSDPLEINFYLTPIDFSNLNNYISGFVKDDSSTAPIQGAQVILLLDGNVSQNLLTDENGYFIIEDLLPVFNYTLLVSADDYLSFGYQFTMLDTTQLELQINLFPVTTTNTSKVFGKVTSSFFANLPVAGTTVELLNVLTGDPIKTAITNNEGNYSFELVEKNSNYVIQASKTDYSDFISLIFVGEDDLEFNFILTPNSPELLGYISGNVSFNNGSPIKDAIVAFLPTDTTSIISPGIAITDESGNYSQALTPGSYYIQTYYYFEDSLSQNYGYYIGEYYDNAASIEDATIIEIENEQTVSNIDFELEMPEVINAVISGTVKDDADQPITGALITVLAEESFSAFYYNNTYAVSDNDGNYSLEVSAFADNSNIKVKASAPGYYTEYFQEQISIFDAELIELTDNGSITNIDFTLTPFSTLDTLALSGNVTDNQGLPLSNVFVFVFGLDGTFNLALTDDMGNYSITTLTEGNYFVYFVASGYVPVYYENAINWEDAELINLTSNLSGINAQLNPIIFSNMPGVVSGYAKDEDNQPLAGVTVMAMNVSNEVIGYSLTDDNGYYSISGLGNGEHDISASELFYSSRTQSVSMNLNSSPSVQLDFVLTRNNPTSVNEETVLPTSFSLDQNYPNPFNPSTKISFTLPESGTVKLIVFNSLGETVTELVNANMDPGSYTVDFKAQGLSSGIYFYRLELGSFVQTKKMMLLK
jgi:hypothetical protein